jgi:endonuclease-3
MDKKKVTAIFERFKEQNPHPQTELVYSSVFELLIAVILSAQATDVGVNKATVKLFAIANTPQAILDLGLEGLKNAIKSIGLYNSKAQNILKTCEILVKHYDSQVPDMREALESLPGVGRKTANVVLNTAFGEPVVAVDTHIFRVSRRIGLSKGTTPLAVEKDLVRVIPAAFLKDAHHWLVLHGRYVCTARKPHCPTCLIESLCEFPDKTFEQSRDR